MARTETTMIPLGFEAPAFRLTNVVSGQEQSLDQLKGKKGTVVMFICNHCPYVIHIREALISLASDYADKGISFIAISSNDAEAYPADGPEMMRQEALEHGFPFPYLYDPTQEVARAYHAACTPDFNVFDAKLICIYRGRFDRSTPGNGVPVTGSDLAAQLDALLDGKTLDSRQFPSMGCNIKWKPVSQ